MYSLPNNIRMIKSRRMRWEGHVARMEKRRDTYGVLVGRLEGKRPLERSRHSWKNNIKMDLQDIGWGEWTRLLWLSAGTGGWRL